MSVSLEPIVSLQEHAVCWVARFGPAHEAYGDPYSGSCVIIRHGQNAHLVAHSGAVISHGERRALQRLIRAEGMQRVTWVRRRARSAYGRSPARRSERLTIQG